MRYLCLIERRDAEHVEVEVEADSEKAAVAAARARIRDHREFAPVPEVVVIAVERS